MATFAEDFEERLQSTPPASDNPLLEHFWNQPVSELVALRDGDCDAIAPEDQERHRIYAGALCKIVYHYWNGNKNGRSGTYPLNPSAADAKSPFLDGDYYGHNISGLAVDGLGRIVDFDFNHNKLFNSSAEHAEARLVRRVFALAQVGDAWGFSTGDQQTALTDYTTLSDVTVYTSLESCAQCSGVMALGRVKQVVYLQTDPGTYLIGRILRNLTDAQLRAPLPTAGSLIGFPQFAELDRAYKEFFGRTNNPFWTSADGLTHDNSTAVTSFLCTAVARNIFGSAASDFDKLSEQRTALAFPDYRTAAVPGSLSNQQVLVEAQTFVDYAQGAARRATPHH